MTPDHTWSLDEAAPLVGCKPRTLRRMVAEGKTGAVRVGGPFGPLRFTAQDIADARAARLTRIEKAPQTQVGTRLAS